MWLAKSVSTSDAQTVGCRALFRLVGKMPTVMEKLSAKTQYQLAICDLGFPTTKRYQIGDELFLLLRLMDESEPIPIVGKVAWLTPAGAEGNRMVGIGIQFSSQDQGAARRRIKDHLADMLASDRPTHTL